MLNRDHLAEHQLTKARLGELVGKHWLLVTVVFIIGTLAMYGILNVFFTEIYETNTRILVKVGRENVETPSTVQRGQVISQGVRIEDINSEVEILSSRGLVDAIVDKLGPEAFASVLVPPSSWTGYPKYYFKKIARSAKEYWSEFLIQVGLDKRITDREKAILAVASGVKVTPVKDSDILNLQVRMPGSKLCVDVANALLDDYLRRRAVVRQAPAGSEFFISQVQRARQRMDKLQADRAAIKTRWDLSAPDEQRSQYLRQLSTIQSELLQNEAEIAKVKRQQQLMTERLATIPDEIRKEEVDSSNPSIQSIKERITALQVERSKTATRYQPGSELLQKIDSEIADLQAALSKEQATIFSSVTSESNPLKREFRSGIEQQSVQIAGLTTRSDVLRKPATQLGEELHNLNQGMDSLEVAEREYHLAEQEYLLYSKRLDESRMSELLDTQRVSNVSLVEPPEIPIKPVAPKKMFLMEIAMPVSLLLGIALAALLETLDDRIVDERSLLALDGVAYLGTVEVSTSA
jgi:polysaccharide biosynthesis protein PslE